MKQFYNPMFSERDTIEEAYAFAYEVAKGSDNPAAVMTAVQVVVNTIAKEMGKILDPLESK